MQFNIRVYGILVSDAGEVLVTDEKIRGAYFTKFPGGGLEWGEGTRDCLQREFLEEMNLRVEVGEHIYTTDYFQLSAFHPGHQIISIYYKVKALEEIRVPISTESFAFTDDQLKVYESKNEIESFRFVPWVQLSEESVSLPIDKIVVRMLKGK